MKKYLLICVAALFSCMLWAEEPQAAKIAEKISKYQTKGEIAESTGALSKAARCFHKIAVLERDPRVKAEWYQREAECWYEGKKTEKAFRAYKALLKNYPLYVSYDIVVPHLRNLAERFVDGYGTFWGLRDRSEATEVYELILREAPSIHVSLKDRSRLAELYEELHRWEEAVVEYQEILKRSPQSDDIRLKFVRLLMKLSENGDGDGARLRAAERNANTILEHQPSAEMQAEIQEILKECWEEEANRVLELAKFYLSKTQYRPQASKKYLEELTSKYAGTKAANEGEELLKTFSLSEEEK